MRCFTRDRARRKVVCCVQLEQAGVRSSAAATQGGSALQVATNALGLMISVAAVMFTGVYQARRTQTLSASAVKQPSSASCRVQAVSQALPMHTSQVALLQRAQTLSRILIVCERADLPHHCGQQDAGLRLSAA